MGRRLSLERICPRQIKRVVKFHTLPQVIQNYIDKNEILSISLALTLSASQNQFQY